MPSGVALCIKERFGALDVLFANAGVAHSSPMEKATEQDFDRIFNVNVKGVFFTVQKALPLLRRGASIMLNASIAPHMGRTGLSLYSTRQLSARSRVISLQSLCRAAFAQMLIDPDQ